MFFRSKKQPVDQPEPSVPLAATLPVSGQALEPAAADPAAVSAAADPAGLAMHGLAAPEATPAGAMPDEAQRKLAEAEMRFALTFTRILSVMTRTPQEPAQPPAEPVPVAAGGACRDGGPAPDSAAVSTDSIRRAGWTLPPVYAVGCNSVRGSRWRCDQTH